MFPVPENGFLPLIHPLQTSPMTFQSWGARCDASVLDFTLSSLFFLLSRVLWTRFMMLQMFLWEFSDWCKNTVSYLALNICLDIINYKETNTVFFGTGYRTKNLKMHRVNLLCWLSWPSSLWSRGKKRLSVETLNIHSSADCDSPGMTLENVIFLFICIEALSWFCWVRSASSHSLSWVFSCSQSKIILTPSFWERNDLLTWNERHFLLRRDDKVLIVPDVSKNLQRGSDVKHLLLLQSWTNSCRQLSLFTWRQASFCFG